MRAIIIDAFVNKFNCSKHDVAMAGGIQATVRTCNDYRGSLRYEVSHQGVGDTML